MLKEIYTCDRCGAVHEVIDKHGTPMGHVTVCNDVSAYDSYNHVSVQLNLCIKCMQELGFKRIDRQKNEPKPIDILDLLAERIKEKLEEDQQNG